MQHFFTPCVAICTYNKCLKANRLSEHIDERVNAPACLWHKCRNVSIYPWGENTKRRRWRSLAGCTSKRMKGNDAGRPESCEYLSFRCYNSYTVLVGICLTPRARMHACPMHLIDRSEKNDPRFESSGGQREDEQDEKDDDRQGFAIDLRSRKGYVLVGCLIIWYVCQMPRRGLNMQNLLKKWEKKD